MPDKISLNDARNMMVERQLERRGIRDPLVLGAMRRVPREMFIPAEYADKAYEDRPLPIGAGQTISQPYIVACMIEALALRGGEKVLEIGGGSGYAAAVMADIAAQVFTIERIPELAETARANLAAAGVKNISVRCSDGTDGWPEEAPFDAILVSAGAPAEPRTLMEQMKIGGRMAVPIGNDPTEQQLFGVRRMGDDAFEHTPLTHVRFVPLIGRQGWQPDIL
ncbi:MAG: protein-L-isoaspartate(D-aspartate) O-methyltransferase [Hyphomicrobium sp.]|jgi:protein-L-isoaspartate(D-aspartate) O-methyltransferase|nr:protein-L-isoaspartate(D-aspartate) O-methyltransferase [Hyphomicrobium sp.]